MRKTLSIFKSSEKKCWFLLIMSYLTFGLLLFLNLYIGYKVILFFKGDGWSFMGGLMIATSYIITIPAFIFSILSIRMVQNNKSKKYLFPVAFGIIGILAGFVLYNAIDWWSLIVFFHVLLIISCIICKGQKQKEFLHEANPSPAATKNRTYGIVVISQIIGLVLLFILTLSFTYTPPGSNESFKQQIIGICVFGLLFLLHGIVTVFFLKKKKWALKFKYIESYILQGLSVMFFFMAVISEGISLTNGFLAIVLFFTLLISMFSYLTYNYKKLKKSGLFILLFIPFILVPHISSAQETEKMQEISLLDKNNFNPYTEFISTDITDYFNPEESGNYPSTNLFDGYLKTCWVSGSVNRNPKSILFIKIPDEIPLDKLILNIFSGYGKNKKLYNANARLKKIKISILSAYNPEGYNTEVTVKYFVEEYPVGKRIVLADTFGVQSFPLNFDKKDLLDFQNKNLKKCRLSIKNNNIKINSAFILKLEITDIYKGNKYDDICISEIFFNNRFVTQYPDRYHQINNVYIKNDNILVADYADKKGVVIYEDITSTFTMVEWEEYSNWAILHYVKNSEAGQNSRIEESYLLVDLRNKNISNNEFEKCTGVSLYAPVIEKNKNGATFLDTFDAYKVELK